MQVLRYDDGPMVALREVSELELYVKQNSSHDIQRKREIRIALRALDGKVVAWPYEYVQVSSSGVLHIVASIVVILPS